jgi:hypothetical protein
MGFKGRFSALKGRLGALSPTKNRVFFLKRRATEARPLRSFFDYARKGNNSTQLGVKKSVSGAESAVGD